MYLIIFELYKIKINKNIFKHSLFTFDVCVCIYLYNSECVIVDLYISHTHLVDDSILELYTYTNIHLIIQLDSIRTHVLTKLNP